MLSMAVQHDIPVSDEDPLSLLDADSTASDNLLF